MVNHWVALIGFLTYFAKCGAESTCVQNISLYYRDGEVALTGNAKSHYPSDNLSRNAVDCSELLEMGNAKNGIYTVWPQSRVADGKPLEVYCDMETDGGGWTLIQKRGPFGRAEDYFNKDWKSYKEGFGTLHTDFWLGNDNIFSLTNQRVYSVRFDLKNTKNVTKYAIYDKFWIDDEYNKYRLHITDYRGDAGNSMIDHDNIKFSAIDQDNDNDTSKHCADIYKGGWWYNACYSVNLNGLYLIEISDKWGVYWTNFNVGHESLQSAEIKIRPRNFRVPEISRTVTNKTSNKTSIENTPM